MNDEYTFTSNLSKNLIDIIKDDSIKDDTIKDDTIKNDSIKDTNIKINYNQLYNIETNNDNKWEPPKTYGLKNSSPIIPSYYNLHQTPYKITNLDYYRIILDDIKNLRPLNKYQLEYIKYNLSDNEKNEIIEQYNKCLKFIETYIND
jgi:hypothetical protein